MKHVFLINPAAGKRDKSREYLAQIQGACAGLDYTVRISQQPGDITAWARQAAAAGQPVRLYACGGDGTLNETVNGAAGFPNAAVTHFPGGSGNDFIKIFSDTRPFFRLAALLNPEEADFDLIDCNGEYALNVCSLGLDARIGTDVAKYKRIPLVSGPGAYLLSALVNTAKGVTQPLRVELPDQRLEGRLTMVYVGNGRWYGGSFHPVPEADPCDGLLDVLLVQPVSRVKVVTVIGKYKTGQYARYPQLIRHLRTDRLEIFSPTPTAVNLDGELRRAESVSIRTAKTKLRFFYPRGLCWASGDRQTARFCASGKTAAL